MAGAHAVALIVQSPITSTTCTLQGALDVSRGQNEPHPTGSSQWFVVHAVLLLLLKAADAAGAELQDGEHKTPAAAALDRLGSVTPENNHARPRTADKNSSWEPPVDANVFPVCPKYNTPYEDDVNLDGVGVAPARSMCGLVTKQLVEWLRGASPASARNVM